MAGFNLKFNPGLIIVEGSPFALRILSTTLFITQCISISLSQDVIIRKEPDFSPSISIIDNNYRNTLIGDSTGYLQDGIYNTAIGFQALQGSPNSFLGQNTALGAFALKSGKGSNSVAIGYSSLVSNTGFSNIGIGGQTLYSNTSGFGNIGIGSPALYFTTTGSDNIGIGYQSLHAVTSGSNNIGIGSNSMISECAASNNIALGQNALTFNQGSSNIGIGQNALPANNGSFNIAIGNYALFNNQNRGNLIAIGDSALFANYGFNSFQGIKNTAIGSKALRFNNTGSFNTALGFQSLFNNTSGIGNTAIGDSAMHSITTGWYNTALGHATQFSSPTLTNATVIGARAYAATSNSLILGSINGVNGATASVNVGIGTTTPANTFAIGASSQFQINNTGNIVKLNNLTTSFPSVQGGSNSFLRNDGSGNLSWATFSGWNLSGNSGTIDGTHFVGTTDNIPLTIRVNNAFSGRLDHIKNNAFWGREAGYTATGVNNAALGSFALHFNIGGNENSATGGFALYTNSSGNKNVASGYQALYSNQTGSSNLAFGSYALYNNTVKGNLVAVGDSALYNNGTGASLPQHSIQNTAVGSKVLAANGIGAGNTAIGFNSMKSNTSGNNNCAVGTRALQANTDGIGNSVVGYEAFYSNTSGIYNVAVGHQALYTSSTGNYNTAVGNLALKNNISGYENTAIGQESLFNNIGGFLNTAIGTRTLQLNIDGDLNTAVGIDALRDNIIGTGNVAVGIGALLENHHGNDNTAIGSNAGNNPGTNPTNFTAIGSGAGHVASNSNRVEIGNTEVTWIGGQVGWNTYSDQRIKDNIQKNVPGLAFINKLKPVTYQLNLHRQNELCGITDITDRESKYDIEKITHSGFLAQEVEQVANEINYDFNGVTAPEGNSKLYSLQYSAFVVPLVKAVQELSAENEILKKELVDLKTNLEERLKNLESQISSPK